MMLFQSRITLAMIILTVFGMTKAPAASLVGGFTVIDTFNFVDARQNNSVGITPGIRDSFGLDLTPVGTQPVTPLDGTTVTATRNGTTVSVGYLFSPVLPNQFFTSRAVALQTTPWTLSFSNPAVNGGLPATIPTPSLGTTTPPPYVSNVSVTTNGLTPTINWSIPPAGAVTNQTLYIIDKTVVTPNGSPTIYTSGSFPAAQTSFTIPPGVLTANHFYVFSVQEDVRSSGQLLARSRSYTSEYNSIPNTPPLTTIQLGTVNVSGPTPAYNFNFSVIPGVIYYLDPVFANGYLYQTGAGDPLFASVSLPSLGSSTTYTLCLPSAGSYACNIDLPPINTYNFAGSGVSDFEVLVNGAVFDTANGLPFISNLTFASAGTFTGSITPFSTSVPEPFSLAILAAPCLTIFLARRRKAYTDRT